MKRIFYSILLTVIIGTVYKPLKYAKNCDIPVIENAEIVEVIGESWEQGDTRNYAIYLDGYSNKIKIPFGHTYITLNELAKTKKSPPVVMIFDLLTVIDRSAIGYTGIGYTFSRIVTDLNGKPAFYQREEWISTENYQPGKSLLTYENYRRTRINIEKNTIKYYLSNKKKKKRIPSKIIKSKPTDILIDQPEWGHLALYLQWKNMETFEEEELASFYPLKNNKFDYYPLFRQNFSEYDPSFKKIKITNKGKIGKFYKIVAGEWTMWFNEKSILQKADNGKGLVIELEE